jgi:hypothetical protein
MPSMAGLQISFYLIDSKRIVGYTNRLGRAEWK